MSLKRKHDHEPSAQPAVAPIHHGLASETDDAADRRFESLYEKTRDFKDLALLDPEFSAVVKGRNLDFADPAAVMQLTKTLLKLDFGLSIDLPDDRLCPPVANRHNYILWLKKLTDTACYAPRRELVGLDIGTGASCIYPLLGCSQRPWSFIATDIDEKNISYARRNVQLNNLESRITILARRPDDSLIPPDPARVDFCMTNPPFYESEADMVARAAIKSRPPSTACTGHSVEMVTPGGEVAFVDRILTESLTLRTRVTWYTAMLGFLSSVATVLTRLRDHGVDNVAVTELVQGSKTRRWAVAWSFGSMRPAQSVARGTSALSDKTLLPPPTEAINLVTLAISDKPLAEFPSALETELGQLHLASWTWDKQKLHGTGRAVGNVWNRAWRRKQKQRLMQGASEDVDSSDSVRFGFSVSIRVGRENVAVDCRWLEGHDAVIFESFQGYLKTTAEALAKK